MAITILEVREWGGRWQRLVVFQHEEDLGPFREKLRRLVVEAVAKRATMQATRDVCLDDIWADIQSKLVDVTECRYQILDMLELSGYPTKEELGEFFSIKVKGLPNIKPEKK